MDVKILRDSVDTPGGRSVYWRTFYHLLERRRARQPSPPEPKTEVINRLTLATLADAPAACGCVIGSFPMGVTATRSPLSGAVSFQIPMSEIKGARNEPLVGGGRLEITTKSGDILPVVYYTMTHAARFSEAAHGIEQLSRAQELLVNLKHERIRCTKCAK